MPELTRRYVVMAMATDAPFDPTDPEGVFVLKPWKDPAALFALAAYRDACYPELGRDLDAWIRTIEAGPVVRGDVGRRNEPYAKTQGAKPSALRRRSGESARAAKRTAKPARRSATRRKKRAR